MISKLIDCWMHNKEVETVEKGRRLGYMGHLIKIFKHITACISESEHIGALIEKNLDSSEGELWQSIINTESGEFTLALAVQNKKLANCNAHEAADYSQHLPKEFLNENITSDYINDFTPSLSNNLDVDYGMLVNDPTLDKFEEKFILLGQQMHNYVCDFLDNDESMDKDNDVLQLNNRDKRQSVLEKFGVTNNPWDISDTLNDLSTAASNDSCAPWATEFSSDNFADFDAHFSSFTNDLGQSLSATEDKGGAENSATTNNSSIKPSTNSLFSAFSAFNVDREYDKNANLENTSSTNTSVLNPFAEDLANKFDKEDRRLEFNDKNKFEDEDDDDYEDDDGIWTKTVGSAATTECDESEVETQAIVMSNGPNDTKIKDDEELNNLNNDSNMKKTPTNELVAENIEINCAKTNAKKEISNQLDENIIITTEAKQQNCAANSLTTEEDAFLGKKDENSSTPAS